MSALVTQFKFALAALLTLPIGGLFWFLSRRSLSHTVQEPLSDAEKAFLVAHVPILRLLPEDLWPKLDTNIQRFLRQITYYGCDGQEVSREMELVIAAQACLLVVNTSAWYHRLRTVLVYPGAFKSRVFEFDGTVMHEYDCVRLGESWLGGPVVLSWEHSEEGANDPSDGHNLVLHEFAHQIDDLSGSTDAIPLLENGQCYDTWKQVFDAAFARHVEHVQSGNETVLDAYGAEDPVEHFAVAVEVFFERPKALRKEEPEVYAQLSEFFRLDPVSWA
ncbi:MAG: M90 family metallopeptidase [Pseudomonadota bacterium]